MPNNMAMSVNFLSAFHLYAGQDGTHRGDQSGLLGNERSKPRHKGPSGQKAGRDHFSAKQSQKPTTPLGMGG